MMMAPHRPAPPPANLWDLAYKVLERHGISTILLLGGALWLSEKVFRPLVESARDSMKTISEKVGDIDRVFREAENHRVEHAVRVTTAVESLGKEIEASRLHREEIARRHESELLAAKAEFERQLRALRVRVGMEKSDDADQ